mgnify:CR=1 FL=1
MLRFASDHHVMLLNRIDTFVQFVEGDSEHSSSQMVKNATSQLTCKICWEAVVGIIFLPCSHLVCCVQCSAAMTQCPVCRTGVAGTIKVNIWLILTLCQKIFRLHHEFYLVFRVNAVAHTAFMPLLVFFITVFLGCNCSNPWMHESRGGSWLREWCLDLLQ